MQVVWITNTRRHTLWLFKKIRFVQLGNQNSMWITKWGNIIQQRFSSNFPHILRSFLCSIKKFYNNNNILIFFLYNIVRPIWRHQHFQHQMKHKNKIWLFIFCQKIFRLIFITWDGTFMFNTWEITTKLCKILKCNPHKYHLVFRTFILVVILD